MHDVRRGLTHAGPHRDDLVLTLDGRDMRVVGSAGQQRTAAFALRLLEAATLRDARSAIPMLLLDDPFAELDETRAARILGLLGAEGFGQVVLAVPRASDVPSALSPLARHTIVHGAVS
jgi:DNA replication and repair protein RecF